MSAWLTMSCRTDKYFTFIDNEDVNKDASDIGPILERNKIKLYYGLFASEIIVIYNQ